MSYKATINGNVNKAFKLLKDLAVTVTFTSKTNAGFDFSTNALKTVVFSSKPVQAIPLDVKKQEGNTAEKSFLFKVSDIQDVNIYDKIVVSGSGPFSGVWNVVLPYSSDGFTITANVVKEL